MNFLSHAIPYLHQPLTAISTGVPDWLGVVDRKIRARQKNASEALQSDDLATVQVAQGILHHIQDDRWFHQTAAFVELNLQLAVTLRDQLPGDRGFRPMFVGHILIEIFLDAFWIRDDEDIARRYYAAVESSSHALLENCVNTITGKPTDRLAAVIERFCQARFLYDYLDDERLLMRLNQVMKRVRLAELPHSILPWLHDARDLVESRRTGLLTRPDGSTPFPSLPPLGPDDR
ncbi:hypothetical protein [Rhodopirellula sp. MGV]|uniref:hypothetical protein n=1 Tax=Rhodopirellula sp. MGV TaxID=2023130 RepID=UPI000B965C83|nr:hypothetical protein [Rhodopirellula sp. MGV]OYP29870.1 hypothetical protein CGZ80_24080 [Rhodopirellula sp. MGV]PNY33752.1 hypothetical protein C2E31_27055 [Rhodopirellula baltica]